MFFIIKNLKIFYDKEIALIKGITGQDGRY